MINEKFALITVYLYTVARALDQHAMLEELASRIFPGELMKEYNRLHFISGL